ncbi:hypothetical protein BC938DRAFT_475639, partial [Jimgerdemannia flammicorona]
MLYYLILTRTSTKCISPTTEGPVGAARSVRGAGGGHGGKRRENAWELEVGNEIDRRLDNRLKGHPAFHDMSCLSKNGPVVQRPAASLSTTDAHVPFPPAPPPPPP